MASISNDKRIMLRKKISLLEWDVSQIANSAILKMKEVQLQACKKELEALTNSNPSIEVKIGGGSNAKKEEKEVIFEEVKK